MPRPRLDPAASPRPEFPGLGSRRATGRPRPSQTTRGRESRIVRRTRDSPTSHPVRTRRYWLSAPPTEPAGRRRQRRQAMRGPPMPTRTAGHTTSTAAGDAVDGEQLPLASPGLPTRVPRKPRPLQLTALLSAPRGFALRSDPSEDRGRKAVQELAARPTITFDAARDKNRTIKCAVGPRPETSHSAGHLRLRAATSRAAPSCAGKRSPSQSGTPVSAADFGGTLAAGSLFQHRAQGPAGRPQGAGSGTGRQLPAHHDDRE